MKRIARNGEGLERGGGVIVLILGNVFSVVGPLSVYLVVESCAWGEYTNEKRRPLKETNIQQHIKSTKELSWYILSATLLGKTSEANFILKCTLDFCIIKIMHNHNLKSKNLILNKFIISQLGHNHV